MFIERGATSIIFHVFIKDSSSATGGGLTGLTTASGIVCYYIRSGEAISGSITLETIATIGTYAAPTSNAHIRFKEVSSANMPGLYEIQIHNDWVNTTNSRRNLVIMLKGATNMVPLAFRIDLTGFNLNSESPDVNALTHSTGQLEFPINFDLLEVNAGGHVISQQLLQNNDKTGYSLTQTFPTNFADLAITSTTGRVTVGTNTDKTGYSLTQTFPTNFSSMLISVAGKVTIGTNDDKTGYTLTQAFPTNFSSMLITVGGALTVGTNNDKTGYSLTQTFPTNFASQLISVSGKVTVGTNDDKTGYSLSQAFPTNFSLLSIDGSGRVVSSSVVGTVGSISGISFPTNFSALSINGSGQVITYSMVQPVIQVTGTVGGIAGITFPSNFNVLSINGSGQVATVPSTTAPSTTSVDFSGTIVDFNNG